MKKSSKYKLPVPFISLVGSVPQSEIDKLIQVDSNIGKSEALKKVMKTDSV